MLSDNVLLDKVSVHGHSGVFAPYLCRVGGLVGRQLTATPLKKCEIVNLKVSLPIGIYSCLYLIYTIRLNLPVEVYGLAYTLYTF